MNVNRFSDDELRQGFIHEVLRQLPPDDRESLRQLLTQQLAGSDPAPADPDPAGCAYCLLWRDFFADCTLKCSNVQFDPMEGDL